MLETEPSSHDAAQKIVTADFSFPPGIGVSEEVRDLLQRIFVVNAAHRLNLEGIKAHPWFLRNLPAELQARRQTLTLKPYFNPDSMRTPGSCANCPPSCRREPDCHPDPAPDPDPHPDPTTPKP